MSIDKTKCCNIHTEEREKSGTCCQLEDQEKAEQATGANKAYYYRKAADIEADAKKASMSRARSSRTRSSTRARRSAWVTWSNAAHASRSRWIRPRRFTPRRRAACSRCWSTSTSGYRAVDVRPNERVRWLSSRVRMVSKYAA